MFIAGLFTFLFTRRLKLSRKASLTASIAFMLSGFFVLKSLGGDTAHFIGIALIPLLFYSFELLYEKRNLLSAIFFGFSMTLSFLSGHPQYLLFSLTAIFLYFLFKIYHIYKEKKDLKKFLNFFIVSFIIFIALSAVQLFPLLEFSKYIYNRGSVANYDYITKGSLPFQQLITLFLPQFFGVKLLGVYWGVPHAELYFYPGLITLILVLFLFFSKKDSSSKFFIFLALFCLLFAFGKYTTFFKLIYIIPVFKLFQVPARMLSVFGFAIAILSAYGIENLLNSKKEKVKPFIRVLFILSIISFLALAFAYLGKPFILEKGKGILESLYYTKYTNTNLVKNTPIENLLLKIPVVYNLILKNIFIAWLLISVSIVSLFLYSKQKIKKETLFLILIGSLLFDLLFFGLIFSDTKIVQKNYWPTIQDTKSILKPSPVVEYLKQDNSFYRITDLGEWIIPQEQIVRNNLFSIEGYDTIVLENYVRYLNSVNYTNPSLEKLGILNVKYIVTNKNLTDNYLILIRQFDDVNVYYNQEFRPRAYTLTENNTIKEADIVYFSPNEVRISTTLENPGYLVYSDVYYPGWKAYEDGKELKIYFSENIFKSVKLNNGQHNITFKFQPLSFFAGLYITLISLFLIMVYIIFRIKNYLKF